LRVVGNVDIEVAGGMKVRIANSVLVRARNVGGRESRKIRIAIVSPIGHDHKIVKAKLRILVS